MDLLKSSKILFGLVEKNVENSIKAKRLNSIQNKTARFERRWSHQPISWFLRLFTCFLPIGLGSNLVLLKHPCCCNLKQWFVHPVNVVQVFLGDSSVGIFDSGEGRKRRLKLVQTHRTKTGNTWKRKMESLP